MTATGNRITAPDTPRGLTARAIVAARVQRATDHAGFDGRHVDWSQWVRRAAIARTVAAAFDVPADHVTVAEDPDRRYGSTGSLPGDLITVTDPDDSHRRWQFIPDLTTSGQGWLLLDECPGCGGNAPLARVATLADLGDYCDPDNDDRFDHLPVECDGDPGHHPDCPHGPLTDERP